MHAGCITLPAWYLIASEAYVGEPHLCSTPRLTSAGTLHLVLQVLATPPSQVSYGTSRKTLSGAVAIKLGDGCVLSVPEASHGIAALAGLAPS